MGPLIPQGIIGAQWDLVIALLIGIAFGFILEASGFSSSRKLMGTFYLYDFTVIRVFFTASVTAMVGLLYFNYIGWINLDLIFINPTFVNSALIGGGIMGLGFIMGGYCPGTSFCGVGIGKIDALFYTIGMFIGILLFSELYPLISGIYEQNSLGPIKAYEFVNIPAGLFVYIVMIVAIIVLLLAGVIERRSKKVEY
ncbi:YeeE/YedE thiosulfate transporter family protein [Bacteroidota bacterium]